ncbi:MAG TPA: extracellular solute-binding protein [Bauldia sp.]|nr:extracellular solute-binding protein [Bauldia sp.]
MASRLPMLTRRAALTLGAATVAASAVRVPWAWAAGKTGLHGLSIFGDLKYASDFRQFDYVDAKAPKGGRMNFQVPNWILNQNPQTFNTLNSFVLKGDAPPRTELLFDTLMARAYDEADAVYGLVAETVDVSDDLSTYTFHLRPEAKFNDGTPLTAEDVAFSLNLLKEKGHPQLAEPLQPMTKAEASDPHTLVVTLSAERNRQTILGVAGDMPIFSKAYYTAHPFDSSSLDVPVGSGAYTVGGMAAGRYIEFKRAPDYWAKDLPVNVGTGNFDIIRIDFFTERQAAFEAFKKGDVTYREEFTSITWAQDYDFPAVKAGKVKKTTEFPSEKRPALQGFYINTRKAKFKDARTREAIGLCFDFEWSNPNLFFNSYTRLASLFGTSEFGASAPPDAAEVAILEPFRADLPPDVFGPPYVPPKTDGSGRDRVILKQASDLLAAAGWKQINGQLVDSEAAPFEIEVLIDAQVYERILTPFANNLKALGIEATVRQVDPAQYTQRENGFDYDIVLEAFSFAPTPLEGLEQFYSSKAADQAGSRNYAGIKEPAVDAALALLPSVDSREKLITVTRAIDRVVRARHYWIPAWYLANHRTAYWDIFGHPATKPDYGFYPETTWWFDQDRAKAIGYTG